MATATTFPDIGSILPEDRNYQRWLITLLCILLAISIIVPLIKVPELTREEKTQLPPQMARILLKPKPAKPIVKPKPPELKQPPKEPPKKSEKPPEAVQKKSEAALKPPPKKTAPKLPPPKPDKQTLQKAREKAEKSGLMKMKNELASLKQLTLPKPTLSHTVSKSTQAPSFSKKMIGKTSSKTANGLQQTTQPINTTPSVNTQADHIKQHQTAQLAPTTNTENAADALAVLSAKTSNTVSSKANTQDKPGIRSESSIRKIFDENKSVIYALYHRALRKQPGLQGKLVVELLIEPSGVVSECSIVSSELNDPALERKLTLRIKMLNFGAQSVSTRKLTYSLDFLPS